MLALSVRLVTVGVLMKKVAAIFILFAVALLWWWPSQERPVRQRPAPVVNVVSPQRTTLTEEIEAVGTAQARASITVTSEVDGRLEKVAVAEGDRVKAGQVMFIIDDRTAKAQLARADAQLSDAQAAWNRAKQLKHSEVLSQAEADTLKAALNSAQADRDAAAAQLANYQIKAPFSGVLGLRQINQGSYIKAGDRLTTLDDLDQLEVLFAVPERYLGQIKIGQRVDIVSVSYADKTFSARVHQLDTRVDPINRTIIVKAVLDNAQRQLLPGQFLAVTLRTGEHQALMIPEQAIVTEGSDSFAYVLETAETSASGSSSLSSVAESSTPAPSSTTIAVRTHINIGARQHGWVEIISADDNSAVITLADKIVINGHTRLGAQSPVDVQDDAAAMQLEIRPEVLTDTLQDTQGDIEQGTEQDTEQDNSQEQPRALKQK